MLSTARWIVNPTERWGVCDFLKLTLTCQKISKPINSQFLF